MRDYEVVFIVRGTDPDDSVDTLVKQFQEVATQQGAEVASVDRWGRHKLAYDIGKQREGHYVLLNIKGEAAAINELERRFKMNEAIIRFLAVRVDDEMKRARRRAALRAKKKGLEPGAELPYRPARPGDDREPPARAAVAEEDEGEA